MFSATPSNLGSLVYQSTENEFGYPRLSYPSCSSPTHTEPDVEDCTQPIDTQISSEDLTTEGFNVTRVLKNRELGNNRFYRRQQHGLNQIVATKLPYGLQQRLSLKDLQPQFDKIFASCWLSEDLLSFGTKDNKLVVWDFKVNKTFNIPLPFKDYQSRTPLDSCGVHFISTNSDRTQLATGAKNPSQISILDLPTLSPQLILEGHQDWVFSAEFITNNRLVSASRDCTINIYDITADPRSLGKAKKPLLSREEHVRKVRDLKYNPNTQHFVTVSADKSVKFWDTANLDVINTIEIDTREICCAAEDLMRNMTAVGSQQHMHLVDHRSSSFIKSLAAEDTWGIRSLTFNNNVLSIGGGSGKLHFYDMRNEAYIPLMHGENIEVDSNAGWIFKDPTFYEHFDGLDISNAVYTHTYSPSGAKLFVGGGPLLLGLKGGYGGVWL